MLALAFGTPAFVAPTCFAARVEGRTASVDCMLGRREIASSAALFALGVFTGKASAMGGDQSKIGVSRVNLPGKSSTNGEPARSGPLDTTGYTEAGKCDSPLSCWTKYPGQNLRAGTCGVNKQCPPAISSKGDTMSPFGINEFKGDSYTNQGTKNSATWQSKPVAAAEPTAAAP